MLEILLIVVFISGYCQGEMNSDYVQEGHGSLTSVDAEHMTRTRLDCARACAEVTWCKAFDVQAVGARQYTCRMSSSTNWVYEVAASRHVYSSEATVEATSTEIMWSVEETVQETSTEKSTEAEETTSTPQGKLSDYRNVGIFKYIILYLSTTNILNL